MSTISLQTVELTTSESTAPLNGQPSSADYNEYQRSVLVDLASLSDFINDTLIGLLQSVDSSAITAGTGLMGSTVYSDTSDTSDIFYDSVDQQSLVVADSLRVLRALMTQVQTSVTNLAIEVTLLAGQSSSSNQNSIAASLANLVSQNASLALTVSSLAAQVNTLQTAVDTVQPTIVTTGNILPKSIVQVPVTFSSAYADNSYVATVSLEEATGELELISFTYQPNGMGLFVLVRNTSATDTLTGSAHTLTKYL